MDRSEFSIFPAIQAQTKAVKLNLLKMNFASELTYILYV